MDEWQGMHEEVMALREALDAMGVSHSDHGACTMFTNGWGECHVFPSVQRSGQLYVVYAARQYCDTVEGALEACGVLGGEDAAD